MRVLFASSEVFPLIKTGGLADVSAALPVALAAAGMDMRILMPGYPDALAQAGELRELGNLGDPLGVGHESTLVEGRLPGSDVPVLMIACPALYDRPDGPYHDGAGQDYADNAVRFGLLSRVAAQCAMDGCPDGWRPDVLHANDWQTGLAPAYLHAWNAKDAAATLFTIHNIAYQGRFPKEAVPQLGFPWEMFVIDGFEYYGTLSFLKAGLFYSDTLSTVSRRYAKEIQTAPFGGGLEGVLANRAADLTGIVNGADYEVWNPANDGYLPHRYGPKTVETGKAANKAALQAEMGLTVDPDAPLVIIVSRLNDIKGMDLVLGVLPALLRLGGQLAVVGTGDKSLEAGFLAASRHNPGQVAVSIGYFESQAHRLLAAGDILLMPSRYEPCGLTQLYALRYGTVPVVHATGGLADTVVDTTYDTLVNRTATGFVFEHANVGALQWSIERAVSLYRNKRDWRRVQTNGLARDFGWGRSAEQYIALYRTLAPPVADQNA